ncbi:PKD domain-containing protein [uncultured Methanobacterium sp.]|uniref:PKD domain-containing protein n=1 Tax=uncultured Methanobacterium sp. TaxID=176306 RepID=UPI002AA826F1|nr:PKD domain-containing protein [uncultured Methanobacterium sp.]
MRCVKLIFPVMAVIILLSAVSPVFAWPPGFSGELGAWIENEGSTVYPGELVYIHVNPINTGESDWENVVISAPIPTGLKYVSHVVPDRRLQDYDPSTGVWNVYQMLAMGRGSDKTLIITCEVLPDAPSQIRLSEGSVKFLSLESVYDYYHNGGNITHYQVAGTVNLPFDFGDSSMNVLKVDPAQHPNFDFYATPTSGESPLSVQFTDEFKFNHYYEVSRTYDFGDGQTITESSPATAYTSHTYTKPGNYTVTLSITNEAGSSTLTKTNYIEVTGGPGVGPDNGPGNGTAGVTNGTGTNLFNVPGNTLLSEALDNLTSGEAKDPLQNLNSGGSGGQKAYEVSQDSGNSNEVPWYMLAILLIVGMIVAGYFYGIRRER